MFSNPVKNLKAFGLLENNIVADLGAGTGFYSVAAGQIALKGKVYAVEINKDFLGTVGNKVKDAHLNNVEILWGDIEKLGGTKLKNEIIDKVIASNILSQVEDKDTFILEIKRILKKDGKVLLVDWSPLSPVVKLKNAIPKDRARELFESRGFTLEREIDTGMHHYGIILAKN